MRPVTGTWEAYSRIKVVKAGHQAPAFAEFDRHAADRGPLRGVIGPVLKIPSEPHANVLQPNSG